MNRILSLLVFLLFASKLTFAAESKQDTSGFVAVISMDMMILPGTGAFLEESIEHAHAQGAKLLIVKINTPGGLLDTSQKMTQAILNAPLPVAIYVAPSGSTATSAGVFITLSGHVAAMSPGTSIGAAHPVSGDGKDIEGDMRAKAENMTVAMVKTIAEQRGRNVNWAEKAVKESNSITEKEALSQKVIDVIADDVDHLLKQLKGKQVKVQGNSVELGDYSNLERRYFEISYKDAALNVLANPNIAALLWLAATTGISLELYNPGAILPGVVGVICLILALAVSQIIPVSQGAVLLLVVGGLLIGAELYTGSLVLGVGGVIAMLLGSIYLIDITKAPGLHVAYEIIVPASIFFALCILFVSTRASKVLKTKTTTGLDGLIGQEGRVVDPVSSGGKVFINGEFWNAATEQGIIEKDARVVVVGVKDGLKLEVKKV